jgi:hypothetical protein
MTFKVLGRQRVKVLCLNNMFKMVHQHPILGRRMLVSNIIPMITLAPIPLSTSSYSELAASLSLLFLPQVLRDRFA